MAQRKRIVITDDLDGRDITKTGVNVPFSLDGTDYEIDLGPKNAAALKKVLQPYMAVARPVPGRRKMKRSSATSSATSGTDNEAIRAWARRTGHQVADRGRIPAAVRQAYAADRVLRSVS